MIICSAILTQNGVVSKKIDLRFQCQHLLLAKTRPFGKLPNLNDYVKWSTFWRSLFVCLCFTCSCCCVKDGDELNATCRSI
jgi:hypothetical protein